MKYPHTFASLDGTTPLPFVWQSAWGALHIDLFSITKLHYPQSSLRWSATLKSDGRQRATAEAASVGGPVCRCRRRRGGCGRSFTSTEPSDHTLSGIAFRHLSPPKLCQNAWLCPAVHRQMLSAPSERSGTTESNSKHWFTTSFLHWTTAIIGYVMGHWVFKNCHWADSK